MKPAAQILASSELVDEIISRATPADRLMANYFRSRRFIGSKDKAAISEAVYSVLRNRLAFEYLLESLELPLTGRYLLAIFLLQQGTDIQQMYNGEQYSPTRLSASAKAKLAELDPQGELDSAPQHVRLNVPQWLEAKLKDALGGGYSREMELANDRATTDIRVNTLKISRDDLQSVLQQEGYETEATVLSPWGLSFKSRVGLFGLKSFNQGLYEVQDQGSQVLAMISGVKAGDTVVDFCAGAGGKSLAMSAMMENKGSLYACDVHTKRLANLAKRAKRAGVHNIRTHVLSSENDKWVKKHRSRADVVLVDAPCSGTGTWRRSPDSRWNLQPQNLDNLVSLQQSILQSASRLVRPGGRLLYATCSLLLEENENQVRHFLDHNDDFSLGSTVLPEPLTANTELISINNSQLRMSPAVSGTDGFFVAVLHRARKL